MIFDRIDQAAGYAFGPLWQQAIDFLSHLPADLAEGRHELRGEDLFAIHMGYDTREARGAVLETHEQFVDIQAVLDGAEACFWAPRQGLRVSRAYDPQKDAAFYEHPADFAARLLLAPGHFAAFFPQDAHMPCIRLQEERPLAVRKLVIKIRRSLLTPGG